MILFTAKVSEKHEQRLKKKFTEETFIFAKDRGEINEHLPQAEIIVTYGEDLDEQDIKKAEKLKWIMVISAGVDKMPFELLKEKGVLLTNAKGIHKIQMTEYVFAMLLQVYRNGKTVMENEQNNQWDKDIRVNEITARTMVVVGTGAIGQEVARIANAFHMKTIGVSKSGRKKDHFDETYTNDELENVLGDADFVIAVLPSTAETKHFFKREHFERMPDHAVFLNMGRGDAVETSVILEAVQEEKIAHAILDVFEEEPLPADSPLWDVENITVTSHIAGLSPFYVRRALGIFDENLRIYRNGEKDYINEIDLDKGY